MYAAVEQAGQEPLFRYQRYLSGLSGAIRAGRRIDASIARYPRGLRIGGRDGDALCAAARVLIAETGASDLLLDEDAGLREA